MILFLEFLAKMGIIFIELMGVLIFGLLVQGIVYNLSNKKINLYKIISFYLLDRYIQK